MLITTTTFHQILTGSIIKHGTGNIPKLREGRTLYVAVKVSDGWILRYGTALLGKEDVAKDGKICYDAELAIKLMAFTPEISGLFKTDTNS